MVTETHRAKAVQFRNMHTSGRILVLPNAWDAGSSRIFEHAGFKAIGTTSAGVAFSLGYPDGERISREEMIESVRRIARAVSVPVTADLEAGYATTMEALAETVREAIQGGAVGMNVEDSRPIDGQLVDVEVMVEKIHTIRRVAESEQLAFVINARTDVYLHRIGEPANRFDHTAHRANAYRDASADCLFVPGVTEAETIGRLVRAVKGPVNILAIPGCPPTAELQRLGVARVSVGGGPARATLSLLRRIATELAEQGTYSSFIENTLPHAEFNRLFGK
jgi:2-methylisocitrate lyase-like PEP mutase family enzyme